MSYKIEKHRDGTESLYYNEDYVYKITHRGVTIGRQWVGHSIDKDSYIVFIVFFLDKPNTVYSFRYVKIQGYEDEISKLIQTIKWRPNDDTEANQKQND